MGRKTTHDLFDYDTPAGYYFGAAGVSARVFFERATAFVGEMERLDRVVLLRVDDDGFLYLTSHPRVVPVTP